MQISSVVIESKIKQAQVAEGPKPPGVQMSSISFYGQFSLTFTNEMVVPSNFTAILNDGNKTEAITFLSKSEARRLGEKAAKQNYLHLVMLRPESIETLEGNLTNWRVSEANSKEIKIVLEFDKPLYVSQGEEHD